MDGGREMDEWMGDVRWEEEGREGKGKGEKDEKGVENRE